MFSDESLLDEYLFFRQPLECGWLICFCGWKKKKKKKGNLKKMNKKTKFRALALN
jgi:hypothetical protein